VPRKSWPPVADASAGRPGTGGEFAEARAYGLTADDLIEWAPFAPIEIYWALRHGVTRVIASRWAREGVGAGDAVRAIALGMTPEEVRPWADAGFAPSDAVEAKDTGVPLEAAVAWRRAGFILPDAALLIRDGWTLGEAVTARYAGIAAADWQPG
jgi:hypothetical protein